MQIVNMFYDLKYMKVYHVNLTLWSSITCCSFAGDCNRNLVFMGFVI